MNWLAQLLIGLAIGFVIGHAVWFTFELIGLLRQHLNLSARERAVADREAAVRKAAGRTAAEANAAIHEITVEDRLAAENDDTADQYTETEAS